MVVLIQLAIFVVSFLCAELPSQLISKKLGPDRWIPVQIVGWSIVAAMQAFLSGICSFYACRALLGLIEGGSIVHHIRPILRTQLTHPARYDLVSQLFLHKL